MAELARDRTSDQETRRKAAVEAAWALRRTEVAGRIEAAALALLEARGPDAVTVEDIATAAGVSRRTFYRYFDAPISVLTATPRRLMERWAAVVRTRPPKEPILTAFRMAAIAAAPEPDELAAVRSALAVMRRAPEACARASGELLAHTTATYRDIIVERLQACGEDPQPAAAIAAGLAAMVTQVAGDCAQDGEMISLERLDQTLAAFGKLMARADQKQQSDD